MKPTKADRQAAWDHLRGGSSVHRNTLEWIETGVHPGGQWLHQAWQRVEDLAQLLADTRGRECEAIVEWLRVLDWPEAASTLNLGGS